MNARSIFLTFLAAVLAVGSSSCIRVAIPLTVSLQAAVRLDSGVPLAHYPVRVCVEATLLNRSAFNEENLEKRVVCPFQGETDASGNIVESISTALFVSQLGLSPDPTRLSIQGYEIYLDIAGNHYPAKFPNGNKPPLSKIQTGTYSIDVLTLAFIVDAIDLQVSEEITRLNELKSDVSRRIELERFIRQNIQTLKPSQLILLTSQISKNETVHDSMISLFIAERRSTLTAKDVITLASVMCDRLDGDSEIYSFTSFKFGSLNVSDFLLLRNATPRSGSWVRNRVIQAFASRNLNRLTESEMSVLANSIQNEPPIAEMIRRLHSSKE